MKNKAKKYKFKYPIAATDIIIFTVDSSKLKVLLIKMKKSPFLNHWACPGGLVRTDESVESSAKRQLKEKTGVTNVYLEQLYTFGEVNRDPFGRVISVSYFALVPSKNLILRTTKEYGGVEWFPVDKLPSLAYDHKNIIKYALQRLRYKLEYTNVVWSLLPKEFTLSELQKVYKIILDKKLDKRNFRKKILSLKILKKTGGKKYAAHRPAELYTFKSHKPEIVKII
ncbi:MAG: NUDIX domain-containing protein [Patescibacteria group bacterium]|nr:NUDIX domain-containing protein [Patescibacteria group bacterium]